MTRLIRLGLINIAILILATACFGSEPEAIPPTPLPVTPLPSATPIPTVTPFPSPTVTPTETLIPSPTATLDLTATVEAGNEIVLNQEIAFQGVSMLYSDKLFTSLVPNNRPAVRNYEDPLAEDRSELEGVPDFILFEGTTDLPTARPPLLYVQEIVNDSGFYYSVYTEEEKLFFDDLRRNVVTQPNPGILFAPDENIVNARYTSFENGTGISSLRFYRSKAEPEEFTNQQLFYSFTGTTSNGRYFIHFQYPVSVETLPDEPTFSEAQLEILAENQDNYTIYLMNEMEQISRQGESEMTPPRDVLDAMIQSLSVEPGVGAPSGTTAQLNVTETPVGTLPSEGELVTPEPEEATPGTVAESVPTEAPTSEPTAEPTLEPAVVDEPTAIPTEEPTATLAPTDEPEPTGTAEPTATPTLEPTATEEPTLAPTETLLPEPTATDRPPSSGAVPTYDANCSNFVVFEADVTIPDGTVIDAGSEFEKTWRVVNKGSCPITPLYTLATFPNNQIEVVTIKEVPIINPNESGDLTVVFRAPEQPGRYPSNWYLIAPNGQQFGQLYVIINSR